MVIFRSNIFVLCISLLTAHVLFAQTPGECKSKTLKSPSNYDKNSESYYLAWLESGEEGQRAIASQMLLEIENKTQYDVTYRLWSCETNDVIKNSLLLALFDQKPATHSEAVTKLLTTEKGSITGNEVKIKALGDETPEPYAKDLKLGYNILYFDWGDNAALRLIKAGYLSDLSFKFLLSLAADYRFHSHREEAKKVLDLFENIPAYEIAPKLDLKIDQMVFGKSETDLYKYAKIRQKQLKEIHRWYETNKSKLKWSAEKKKYVISDETPKKE